MRKRFLPALLALSLALTLPLPVLGAEGTTFVDVSPGDWFAPYVEVCVEAGLMKGTGEGRFAPDKTLSSVECAVLAMRLMNLQNGGNGILAPAPADWVPSFYTELPLEEGTWYREAWYYADQEERGWLLPARDGTATRDEFAYALWQVCGFELPHINDIRTLPDTEESDILDLYNVGILNGTNAYGSFCGNKTLTRAECATMLARVLEPSLRLKFDPFPTPEFPAGGRYTLTYLMDGTPDCGVTYPVCLLGYSGEDAPNGILTLDGRLLPWPEGGVPSYGVQLSGDYLYLGSYDQSTEDPYDTRAGLMDRSGEFIVPQENGRSLTYAVEGGFFTEIQRESGTVWELLDEGGQFVRELEQIGDDPRVAYPPKGRNPLRGIEDFYSTHGQFEGSYYVDDTGLPVSQKFDWAGHISDDGQGFVGMDGKIYRIEFER